MTISPVNSSTANSDLDPPASDAEFSAAEDRIHASIGENQSRGRCLKRNEALSVVADMRRLGCPASCLKECTDRLIRGIQEHATGAATTRKEFRDQQARITTVLAHTLHFLPRPSSPSIFPGMRRQLLSFSSLLAPVSSTEKTSQRAVALANKTASLAARDLRADLLEVIDHVEEIKKMPPSIRRNLIHQLRTTFESEGRGYAQVREAYGPLLLQYP